MTLGQNLRWKLISALVLATVVWLAAGLVGFPDAFRWFFAGYVIIALPFFVLLDTRFSGEPRRPVLAIVTVFLIAAGALSLAAFFLPQYSTRVERDKIARLQKAFLERQAPEREKALRVEAEKLGLRVVKTGETTTGPSTTGEVSPAMIAQGKQVYEDYECYNCHQIGGKGSVKRRGPQLDNIGSVLSSELIKIKIQAPRLILSQGFEEEYDKDTMPDDYDQRMSDEQISALVAYLSTLKDTNVKSPKALFAGRKRETEGPWYEIPPEFQKVMPRAWWTDPKIIAEGKAIYEGVTKPDVVCAACHGRDGVPVLTGASDFRNRAFLEGLSEVYWYWRIAKGVSGTAMTAWGEKLTTEEIWKVMAYENTFAYGGQPTDHAAKFRPPKAQVK
jgi:mono/diheme cytochrome c family protein